MRAVIAYIIIIIAVIGILAFVVIKFRAKAVNATLQVTEVTHDGHQYLVFVPATSGDFAVVHSASCPKH